MYAVHFRVHSTLNHCREHNEKLKQGMVMVRGYIIYIALKSESIVYVLDYCDFRKKNTRRTT